jgi:DNA primase
MKFTIPENIVIAFLQDNFGDIKHTSTGEIRINSPFEDDNKFHMYVNPEKGVVHDFKSGYSGSFIAFVGEFLEIGSRAALSYLIKNYSGRNEEFSMENYVEKVHELEIPTGLNWLRDSTTGVIARQAYHYLTKRNVPLNVIDELGYVFDSNSVFNKMIFIPFYEEGKMVYFVCRDFTDKHYLRYNFPPLLNSKNFVYNIDKIEETVFIFEGIFDAFMLKDQVGTAMLSQHLGSEQAIKILDRAPKNIIFVPDNDETGEETLDSNIKLLLKFKPPSIDLNIMVYKIKKGKDFADTGDNHIELKKCKEWKRLDLENVVENIFRR